MNIFTVIGVIVVVIFVAGYFGLRTDQDRSLVPSLLRASKRRIVESCPIGTI